MFRIVLENWQFISVFGYTDWLTIFGDKHVFNMGLLKSTEQPILDA